MAHVSVLQEVTCASRDAVSRGHAKEAAASSLKLRQNYWSLAQPVFRHSNFVRCWLVTQK